MPNTQSQSWLFPFKKNLRFSEMRAYMHPSMSVGKEGPVLCILQRLRFQMTWRKNPIAVKKDYFISFSFFFYSGRVVSEFECQRIPLNMKYVDCIVLFIFKNNFKNNWN